MANVPHNQLTGADLHEPKGVATATVGQVYIADGAGSGDWTDLGQWTRVVKSANTSRSSTTTLTADPDLTFSVEANERYMVRGRIQISAGATPDFKWGFAVPAGASLSGIYFAHEPNDVTPITGLVPPTSVPGVVPGSDTVTVGGVLFDFTSLVDSTSGSIALHWAQNSSSGTATQVLAGSYLEYIKVT